MEELRLGAVWGSDKSTVVLGEYRTDGGTRSTPFLLSFASDSDPTKERTTIIPLLTPEQKYYYGIDQNKLQQGKINGTNVFIINLISNLVVVPQAADGSIDSNTPVFFINNGLIYKLDLPVVPNALQ